MISETFSAINYLMLDIIFESNHFSLSLYGDLFIYFTRTSSLTYTEINITLILHLIEFKVHFVTGFS